MWEERRSVFSILLKRDGDRVMKIRNERGLEQLLKKASSTYVEYEGKKIIEEANQLNKQSGEPLPENYTKFMDDLFTDNQKVQFNKSKEKKNGIPLFYKASVAVAVVMIVFNISVVSVPVMRSATLGFLVKESKVATQIQSNDANKENSSRVSEGRFDIEWTEEYNITYLPEGFSALTSSCSTLSRCIEYADVNDNSITFEQDIDSTTYSIDTENAKVEYVDINGKRAMYVEKEYEEIGNTNKLLWKEDDYFIGLDGIGVTKEELVKVAESVKKN